MCGITGFIDFKSTLNREVLALMSSTLNHRGPDDEGIHVFNAAQIRIGFAQRRLSIIDLSPLGHQPMIYQNLKVVFNGEIYNYREIRKELEKCDYTFESESDTEVILKAYHKWGIECLTRFIGMFAIVLFDELKDEVILIRDRAGVKPLYFYKNDNQLILFSSELKAFLRCEQFIREIDRNSVRLFLKYGYIPAPYTIYQNTYKVKPGHYIRISLKSSQIEEHQYWDVTQFYNKPKLTISFQEALERTEALLISACNYRMVADVPVGVFLSGGYDSSTVCALLQKYSGQTIKTFSIGFDEDQYNEAHYAKKIAEYLETEHHEYYCSVNEAKSIIPDLPKIFDEPFGDSSAIPTTLVSKIAVKKVKVALSADAGDEIFAGYGNYGFFLQQYLKIQNIPISLRSPLATAITELRPLASPLSRLFYNLDTRLGKLPELLKSKNPGRFNEIMSQYFTDYEISKLMPGHIPDPSNTYFDDYVDEDKNDFINIQLAVGYKTFLMDDILTKVDRSTMSVGLEGREPFLDHRIIEFVAQLPSDFKFSNGKTKILLKEIAHRYIPKELIDRPKMGFSIPVENWLKGDLKYLIETYLSRQSVERVGVFHPGTVSSLCKDFISGKRFNFSKIWFLLMFQMWAEKWLVFERTN